MGGGGHPLVGIAKVDQGLDCILDTSDELKVGLELDAIFLEKSQSTFFIGRYGRKPGSGAQRTYGCRRNIVRSVQARRGYPQGFAYPPEDILALARVHRDFQ
jgi:hypothetical protein